MLPVYVREMPSDTIKANHFCSAWSSPLPQRTQGFALSPGCGKVPCRVVGPEEMPEKTAAGVWCEDVREQRPKTQEEGCDSARFQYHRKAQTALDSVQDCRAMFSQDKKGSKTQPHNRSDLFLPAIPTLHAWLSWVFKENILKDPDHISLLFANEMPSAKNGHSLLELLTREVPGILKQYWLLPLPLVTYQNWTVRPYC